MKRATHVCIVIVVLIIGSAAAKQVKIRVVDGRNDKPLKGVTVDIWFGRKAVPPPSQVTSSDDGTALVIIPDPIDTVLIGAQLVGDCRRLPGSNKNYIENNAYGVDDILRTGIVTQNNCGRRKDELIKGVLVYYVTPLHWWERIHD